MLTIALGYLMMVVIGPDRPGAGYYVSTNPSVFSLSVGIGYPFPLLPYVINREAATEIIFSYMLFAIV